MRQLSSLIELAGVLYHGCSGCSGNRDCRGPGGRALPDRCGFVQASGGEELEDAGEVVLVGHGEISPNADGRLLLKLLS
jgi:hypothetical protein